MMGHILKLFVSAFTLAALSMCLSCTKRSEPAAADPILESYRLIDAGRYDEAIALLESTKQNAPDKQRHLEALSSAYAGYAGVDLKSLSSVINEISNLEKLESNSNTPLSDRKVDRFIVSVIEIVRQAYGFMSIYSAIPSIPQNKLIFLTEAIKTLDGLPAILPRNALYRAILRIVEMKSLLAIELETSVIAVQVSSRNSTEQDCKIDLSELGQLVLKLAERLAKTLIDVRIARPSLAPVLEPMEQSVASSATEVGLVLATAVVIDELSLIVLEETLISSGLGKLVQCRSGPDSQ